MRTRFTPDKQLALGVIGLSPGNGHPYSWSAIFNGYDKELMEACPFPVIAEYLNQQAWPDSQISGARVTHVHVPEKEVAVAIANATAIPRACGLEELCESVDAVLLARDDSKNHISFAKGALRLGKPIYIDKPIAQSRKQLKQLRDLQPIDGLIFTCSALSFSPEFQPLRKAPIDQISRIRSCAPNDWARYGMHAIEPVVSSMWPRISAQEWESETLIVDGVLMLKVRYDDGLEFEFVCSGLHGSPFEVSVSFARESPLILLHKSTFAAFRSALVSFVEGVRTGTSTTNFEMVAHCVDLLDRATRVPNVSTSSPSILAGGHLGATPSRRLFGRDL